MSQEVTYFRDCRPGKVSRNYTQIDKNAAASGATANSSASSSASASAKAKAAAVAAGGAAAAARNGSNSLVSSNNSARARANFGAGAGAGSGSGAGAIARPATATAAVSRGLGHATMGRGGGQVVRTIYMPNESVDVLKLIVQSLRTQLDEQKSFAEQRCQALTEDRIIREGEAAEREAVARRTIGELQRDLKALMEVHTATTKDYLDLRQELQQKEKVRASRYLIDLTNSRCYVHVLRIAMKTDLVPV